MRYVATLLQWKIIGTNAVVGTIGSSTTKEYSKGEKIIFMNGHFEHYAYAEGMWPDHFILRTNTGNAFILTAKEQV